MPHLACGRGTLSSGVLEEHGYILEQPPMSILREKGYIIRIGVHQAGHVLAALGNIFTPFCWSPISFGVGAVFSVLSCSSFCLPSRGTSPSWISYLSSKGAGLSLGVFHEY